MSRNKRLNKEWWIKILNEAGVEWRDVGHNVKKGNIQINCPFCSGTPNGKFHLGISPSMNGAYGCWRNTSHRGRSPVRLLMKLLRMPKYKVQELIGDAGAVDLDSWDNLQESISTIFDDDKADQLGRIEELHLPQEFEPITPFGAGQAYFDYLVGRGFPRKDVRKLIKQFNLYYCDEWNDDNKRNWCYRIITPVTIYDELVSWGSRTIRPKERLRYKSLSKEDSVVPVKDAIYNFDNALNGGRILIMAEGQVDVWKLDFYGKEYGIRAVGLFSKALAKQQLYLLNELFSLYTHSYVLLDAGEEVDAWLMSGELSSTRKIESLSFTEAEDPGAATPEQLDVFFRKILKNTYPKRGIS